MEAIVVGEPNTIPHVEGFYAFISKDDKGNEGLCAFQFKPGNWMPLVTIDENRLEFLAHVAEEIANRSGHDVILVKFSNREELKRFAPKEGKADGTLEPGHD